MDLSMQDLLEQQPTSLAKPAGQLETKKWLFEKRLEYARYFFDHHAKQRMTMLNFFLIFVGLTLSAYSSLVKDGQSNVASPLALFGALLTLVFVFLDRRNEELVHVAEDVLGTLENDVLFFGYNRDVEVPRRRKLMRLNASSTRRPLGIFRRQGWDQKDYKRSFYEHGTWVPVLQLALLALFVVLSFLPLDASKGQSQTAPHQSNSPPATMPKPP
jgi:hypothetical protein